MLPRSQEEIFGRPRHARRYDARTARHILERAVAEQYRLEARRADSYSHDELQEMAREAGVSRAALNAAIDRVANRGPLARRWHARRWSTKTDLLLAGAGTLVLLGSFVAFPAIAYVVVWTLIVVAALILLGAMG